MMDAKRVVANFLSEKKRTHIGKFLAYVLRHNPGSIGLTLDNNGWAKIDDLIAKSDKVKLTKEIIEEVVRTDNKSRYKLSEDGERIRASQGHSVNVDLGLEPTKPPKVLYQGTATRFLSDIFREGLKKMNRQHVHLSVDKDTALNVGSRHGKPIILKIDAEQMHKDGHEFFLSDNKVWLTDHVPVKYISKDEE